MDVPASAAPWSPRAKIFATALVALHLAAVFIGPMAFAVRPGSPAVDPLHRAFRPYIQAMSLDHGYAFFAPDPGPSHLVEYKLHFADRRPVETGRFPNIDEHWPRLLYHRHFMLSETLERYYVPAQAPRLPADLPAEERSEQLAQWRAARDQFEMLRDGYARHVAHERHAESATVHRMRHDLLPPPQFTRERNPDGPSQLNDERTYRDLDAEETRPAERAFNFPVRIPPANPETLPRGNP